MGVVDAPDPAPAVLVALEDGEARFEIVLSDDAVVVSGAEDPAVGSGSPTEAAELGWGAQSVGACSDVV